MNLNYEGVVLAAASLLIIAAYHPLVIKAEYQFGARVWPLFAVTGLICLAVSVRLRGVASPILAFLGATNLWSVVELKAQAKRVRKGWFPKNPRRKYE
ncbi:DUF4491 family protein [Pyramidobacter piscolens]|uniref:DUF4491 family protein n=1 Tax=Pyramidobacter piscolens TaxID=638849 RepID=UPI0028F0BE2B|nr:DUF4491 family protein [Pyramidobacter piscolens]